MVISTRDHLIDAIGNNSSRIIIDKASISSRAIGDFTSLWRSTGQPGQGAIPTTVAVCDDSLTGALQFAQQTAPATSYLGVLEGLCTNAGTTLEIHDRLVHMGGLSGAVTTAQSVNLDLDSLLGTSNLDARKGDANYSDVQWWVEWYADTGATAANLTVNVVYNDGTTGALTVVALAATRRAQWLQSLNSLIPAAASGKYIRGVTSVQLSVSTGAAGNFGITATRYRAAMYKPVANARFTQNWADLGLPEIPNDSCLFPVQICGATSTGIVRATGKIIHG
ncbi:MAG: hypothetical protein MUF14_09900 [Hyphomonadaceae bacterium]|jgi:hypothetical protein|nr:hypothetical protein [Hyphomonadaceae bacterium]